MIPATLQITGLSRSGVQASACHGVYPSPYYIPRYVTQEVFKNTPFLAISAQVNSGGPLPSTPVYQMVHVRTDPSPPCLPVTQFTALPPVAPGVSSPRTRPPPVATGRFKCLTPACQKWFDRHTRAEACHNRHLKARPHVCRGACGNQNWSVQISTSLHCDKAAKRYKILALLLSRPLKTFRGTHALQTSASHSVPLGLHPPRTF